MGLELGNPLLLDVLEGVRVDSGEADQEDVGASVAGLGAEVDVVVLSGSIPEGNIYKLPIKFLQDAEVVEDGGDVMLNKPGHGVSHQQTALPNRPVAHDAALDDFVDLPGQIIALLGALGGRIFGTGCHDFLSLFCLSNKEGTATSTSSTGNY